eukprot:TRINITY_DN41502_c0_g1_i1.p1 TRINITY_DN41502_c0_g1~~TRINITY_DN41502_c0_g1_i1.p1  ORF type:complete len:357 (-),score=44.36 TRINITY_DN41502_c0_g1_i1:44-1114(-)
MPNVNIDLEVQQLASYKLPPNLWGALLFIGYCAPRSCASVNAQYMCHMIPVLLICITIQILFMWYVYEIISEDEEQTCSGGRSILRLLCLFVLAGNLIVRDFAESVGIWQWARQFPAYISDRQDKCFTYMNLPDLGVAVPVTGITMFQYRCAVLLVLVKTALGVGLLYIAAGYVALAASSENLMQNSVAMLFISEADELCYLLIVPDFVRRELEALPPIVKHPDAWDASDDSSMRQIYAMAKIVIKWWVTLVVTGSLYWSWCREDYFPDVIDHIINFSVVVGCCIVVLCCVLPCCFFGCAAVSALGEDENCDTTTRDILRERFKDAIEADTAGSIAQCKTDCVRPDNSSATATVDV